MKIRTITIGVKLDSIQDIDKIKQVAEINNKARAIFEEKGYSVQTVRITTNSWTEYLNGSDEDIVNSVKEIEKVCLDLKMDELSIGHVETPEQIKLLTKIKKETTITCFSAKVGDVDSGILFENAKASAEIIKQISEESENGFGNFNFCAWCNCPSGIPFYPASIHLEDETILGIGLECGDLAMKAFSGSSDLIDAEKRLKEIFETELKKVEEIGKNISEKFDVKYRGIDSSLAPSIEESESIALAYEKLGFGKFGCSGTLTISGMITRVLKSLSVKLCGYSGLMLPVCEDFGLAKRANEGTYGITNLLLYSAVCGCGLDTVPIPGDVTVEQINAIILDMATLAIKLNKPLSARLFPVPGKKAGELTEFDSPYLLNCKILGV